MGAYMAKAPSRQSRRGAADEDHPSGHGGQLRAPVGLCAAGVAVLVWLIVDPRTPDLAGQVYRANLFGEAGFAVWDTHWYAGHHLPGYSLVFPPVGALLGVRLVGALAVLTSAALFERLIRPVFGRGARWGTVWFALAALGDVWSGRVAFALGVSLALAATLALVRGRVVGAVVLGGLCAATSPVAGALLGLAGLTHSLTARSPRSVAVLGAPAVVVVLALRALFPEGGWEPYPLLSFLATLGVVGGFLWTLPSGQRLLRTGALVYLAACVVCLAVHTPMGANVERYGVLLAGPLLLCVLGDGAQRAGTWAPSTGAARTGASRTATGRRIRGWGVAGVLCGIAVWAAWGPVRETVAVVGNASTDPAYYTPVERYLAAHGGDLVRVEVPFTRGHWEAAWLAQGVLLARGWEKQLDERYDGVLLARNLTAGQYYRWLHAQAVTYVALPDAALDPSSAREGRLIRAGLPYLREVLRTPHWRIYAVRDPTPLAQGPGEISAIGHDWFELRARAAGRFVVRVRYTRYWTVTRGAACVSRASGGWTAVIGTRPGTVRVAASFSLGRALGLDGGSCQQS